MIALFLTYVSLIIPNVYAQEYNPSSDTYDSIVNVLLPLIIISVYNSSDRMKKIVCTIEFMAFILLIFCFPPIYNFYIYKSTSKYDYVCMISSFFAIPYFIGVCSLIMMDELPKGKPAIIIGYLELLFSLCTSPATTFAHAIYWIKKDVIIEKIGYEWFIVASSIIFLIMFILLLLGKLGLAWYFYVLVSVGLCFSIAYSNNFFFTKLVLALMSYFMARMFDKEALIGKIAGDFRIKNFISRFKGVYRTYYTKKMLRFYIDEAEGLDGHDIKFTVDNGSNENNHVQVRYDSTAPRVAYYIYNIQYTNINLNIKVNGSNKNYPLNELKSGILVQTPKLWNRIILTMTLLDDTKDDKDDDYDVIEIKNDDEINNHQMD